MEVGERKGEYSIHCIKLLFIVYPLEIDSVSFDKVGHLCISLLLKVTTTHKGT